MVVVAVSYLVLVRVIGRAAEARVVLDSDPGRVHRAAVTSIPEGIGQGRIAVSRTPARLNAIGGSSLFPAVISVPPDVSRESLRLVVSGTVTVYSGKAGVVGLIASILLRVNAHVAHLQRVFNQAAAGDSPRVLRRLPRCLGSETTKSGG